MWAIVGFLFWIPLLIRITAAVGAAILASALSESDPAHLTISFERAATFYARGFELIRQVFFPPEPHRIFNPEANHSPNWEKVLLDTVWTIIFWGTFAVAGYRTFGPEPALPSVKAYVSAINIWQGGRGAEFIPSPFPLTEFDSATTQFVYTRVALRHRAVETVGEVPMACRYLGPSPGIAAYSMNDVYRPSRGDTAGIVEFAVGYHVPGHWPKGKYRAECAAEGRVFLKRAFTIN